MRTEKFNPQVLAFFGLGLASQAPVNLIGGTLKYWFSTVGIDLTKIGLFGLVLLPYTLKFLWAPFIDLIDLPWAKKWGRKKEWGLLAQFFTMVFLFLLSLSNPNENLMGVFALCLGIAFMTATSDIVIDALRIDLFDRKSLAQATSCHQFGARIGMLAAVAGMIFLSAHMAWQYAYQISIGLIFIGFLCLLCLKEKNTPKPLVSIKEVLLTPFKDLLHHEKLGLLVIFVVAYKLCNGVLGPMAYPFYYNVGFSAEQISFMSGTLGVFITMFGIFLGGFLAMEKHLRPILFCLGFVEIFTSFSFAALAEIGPSMNAFFWVILFDNIVGGIGNVVWITYLSSLCNKQFSGTQYAFFAALNMVPLSLIASSGGWLASHLGWPLFFLTTGLLMLPALFMILFCSSLFKKTKEISCK